MAANLPLGQSTIKGVSKPFPGISYIPDLIEVAEDKDLMSKIYLEFLDFLQCVTDLLDLMHQLKNRHLRTSNPIPHNVLREMLALGDKGRLYKEFDRRTQEITLGVNPSLESIIRRGGAGNKTKPLFPPILQKTEQTQQPFRMQNPLQADLIEITGKKTKPIWHNVAMEKEDFLSTQAKQQDKQGSLDFDEALFYCKSGSLDVHRTSSEILTFSIRFCLQSNIPVASPRFRRQMDMMLASKAGFSTVEAHKAYVATKKAQWYRDFVQETVKLGLLGCQEVVQAFERLGKHYDMTRDSLPLAKAKLCLLIQSLPFWDVGRIQMQRAVEFILERILHIVPDEEEPLREWLKTRKIPYVVIRPFSAEDFIKHYDTDEPSEMMPKSSEQDTQMENVGKE